MPFDTKYNRMIADELDRINENKADYMAYSNQVYMNGNKFVGANDLTKVPEGLRPKYICAAKEARKYRWRYYP